MTWLKFAQAVQAKHREEVIIIPPLADKTDSKYLQKNKAIKNNLDNTTDYQDY
ncbi:MAG: hypothetical protein AAF383_25245 [Cyanobacteria bacterium P01_A01_bin.83]